MAERDGSMANDSRPNDRWTGEPPRSFALSGKIMLSAIVILFTVIIFMLLLHIYARWYLLTVRRRELRRRRSRQRSRAHLIFYVDHQNGGLVAAPSANSGLDATVLGSLPVFVYNSKTHPETMECAVCLSEFEDNEKGRLLPKCNHSFHIDCIDMWFQSHSNCPLCRSPVEPADDRTSEPDRPDVVISVAEPGESRAGQVEAGPIRDSNASTSLGVRRKGMEMTGVSIEVPRRNASEVGVGVGSPASQGFKSPGGRLLSLKRLLSMNRIMGQASTSSGTAGAEPDVECAKDESTQGQTRPNTPRS